MQSFSCFLFSFPTYPIFLISPQLVFSLLPTLSCQPFVYRQNPMNLFCCMCSNRAGYLVSCFQGLGGHIHCCPCSGPSKWTGYLRIVFVYCQPLMVAVFLKDGARGFEYGLLGHTSKYAPLFFSLLFLSLASLLILSTF